MVVKIENFLKKLCTPIRRTNCCNEKGLRTILKVHPLMRRKAEKDIEEKEYIESCKDKGE